MSGLFGALEIAKRSLLAGQAGLQVTGQNIANASTPGYSRRVLEQSPSPGARLASGFLGGGVDARRIVRARDAQLDARLLDARAQFGDATTRSAELDQIEALVGDLEEGALGTTLQEFLDGWHDLSFSPESISARQALRENGTKLASVLNRLSNGLGEARDRILRRVPGEVADVNARIARVAELSRQIGSVEAGGIVANDLRDERGREIEALAERIDVNFTEAPNGSFLLRVGGVVVADGERVLGLTLAFDQSATGGETPAPSLTAGGVAVTPRGGSLHTSLTMVETTIAGYGAQLDEIAQGIADSVNALHREGYGLDGATGNDFFETEAGGAAAGASGAASRFRIAQTVAADPSAIAASMSGAPGDNAMARAIGDLGTAPTLRGGTRTMTQLVSEFSGTVAADTGAARFASEAGGALIQSLENRRDSISGVSLDEEAVNLVKYQQAFEAAARVVAVTNQMMDTLLNEI